MQVIGYNGSLYGLVQLHLLDTNPLINSIIDVLWLRLWLDRPGCQGIFQRKRKVNPVLINGLCQQGCYITGTHR